MINRILLAAQFAASAHFGQKRKYSGRPYIEHPLRVAGQIAIRTDATEEAVSAAYLHDVLEDTPVTYIAMYENFGIEVTNMVRALSHPPHSAGNRATRMALYREQLKAAPTIVQVIKLHDRLDNLREMGPEGDFNELYARETYALLEAIGDADPILAEEVRNQALNVGKGNR